MNVQLVCVAEELVALAELLGSVGVPEREENKSLFIDIEEEG
jgi:hypothetical protein